MDVASIAPRLRRMAASRPVRRGRLRAASLAPRRIGVALFLLAVATVAQFDRDRLFETRAVHRTGAKCRSDAHASAARRRPALLFILHEAR
ncbi:hypothetical protein [Burkholderia mayonis]|uniref:hypothetical protein n=1 Tax=Burkholderia mayonis TaxID=1385591 RepID=UPI00131F20DB|nr:hypothetical protein [Burkholderia mayonis]